MDILVRSMKDLYAKELGQAEYQAEYYILYHNDFKVTLSFRARMAGAIAV